MLGSGLSEDDVQPNFPAYDASVPHGLPCGWDYSTSSRLNLILDRLSF